MVVVEQDEDGVFVGSVPSVKSCYAEGESQEEMMNNLREVLKLCLRNQDFEVAKTHKFLCVKNLELDYA